jgi:hypothetical protein
VVFGFRFTDAASLSVSVFALHRSKPQEARRRAFGRPTTAGRRATPSRPRQANHSYYEKSERTHAQVTTNDVRNDPEEPQDTMIGHRPGVVPYLPRPRDAGTALRIETGGVPIAHSCSRPGPPPSGERRARGSLRSTR